MPQFEFYNLLLCYNYFNGYAIQIANFIFSIIGSAMIIYGNTIIPFYIDINIYKFLFSINIPYFIVIVIFNIVFLLFRWTDLMNNGANLWAFGLSIIQIYVAIFGIITNLINDTMIFYNISNYQKLSIQKNSPKFPLLTKGEIYNTKIILPIIFIIWINILYLCISDAILINLRINGSYSKYCLALKKEELYNSQNIELNQKKQKIPKKKKISKKQKKQKNQNTNNNNNNNNTDNNIEINESINKDKNNNENNGIGLINGSINKDNNNKNISKEQNSGKKNKHIQESQNALVQNEEKNNNGKLVDYEEKK